MSGGGTSNASATGAGRRQTADFKGDSLLRRDCLPGDSVRGIHGLHPPLSHFRNEKKLGNRREAWSPGAAGEIAVPRLEKRQAHRPGRFGAQGARAQTTADCPGLAEGVGLILTEATLG